MKEKIKNYYNQLLKNEQFKKIEQETENLSSTEILEKYGLIIIEQAV